MQAHGGDASLNVCRGLTQETHVVAGVSFPIWKTGTAPCRGESREGLARAQLQRAVQPRSGKPAARPPTARQDRCACNLASLFHQSQNPKGTTKT